MDEIVKIGRELLKEKKYEEAIVYFNELVEKQSKASGDDMALDCAIAWFEYGNALLTKEEDCPSDDLIAKPKDTNENEEVNEIPESTNQTNNELDLILSGIHPSVLQNQSQDNENNDEEEDDNQEEEEEEVNDLQIAWEAFEVCREIYEKKIKEVVDSNEIKCFELKVAEVYVRLGDLQVINNNFSDALLDFNKALVIRKKYYSNHDRSVTSVYYALALAHLYNSSELINKPTDSDSSSSSPSSESIRLAAIHEKNRSLEYYKLTKQSIDERITNDTSLSSEDLSDSRELSDELAETIDSLNKEIEENTNTVTNTTIGATTIGFNNSSSSHSTSLSTSDYFNNLSDKSNKRVNVSEAQLVQVKKKTKKSESK